MPLTTGKRPQMRRSYRELVRVVQADIKLHEAQREFDLAWSAAGPKARSRFNKLMYPQGKKT